ncbi:tetratricopeptide repeat protein [Microbulbifer sp. CNSA002]|uniref:tetratricopeptide repeat protein n=1 Tax=unclassified Microbulbifer TaxID=2619833 RepID=UPI0039B3B625
MKYNRIGISKRLILAGKYKKAIDLLLPIANARNEVAQLILGYLYFMADSGMDGVNAKKWLEKSAKQGNADALYFLATTDFTGNHWASFGESKAQIAKVRKAAVKGSTDAQRWLAVTYAHGEVVPPDYTQIVYWDTKAAEQGLSESQRDLGVMWMSGEAGHVDIAKSLYWYKQCVTRNHNVTDSKWAFRRIIEIYEGRFGKQFKDLSATFYWKKRSRELPLLPYRHHPDWFYQ